MVIKNLLIYQLPIICLSILIGVFVSIFTIPASVPAAYIFMGLLLLPVLVYQTFIHQGAMLLFVLFASFGIMNTAIKPFDLLFVVVAGLFFLGKKQKLRALREIRFVNYTLTLFIVVSLLSVINSRNSSLGTSYFIHTLFVILIFYFIAVTIRTKKEFNAILYGYVATALFSALAVIFEKIGLIGVIGERGTWFQGVRAQGFFVDPNDFSPFLILAIVLLLEKAFSYHYFSIKYLSFVTLAGVLIACLLAAMSRAAILDFAIVLLIYFFYTLFYKKKYGQIGLILFLTVLISGIVLMIAGDQISHYLSIRFLGSSPVIQDYDTDRFFYQSQGILLGSSHLFGIGPGQFEYYFGYATHSLFIRIIAENGWIAFLLFSAVIVYIFFLLFYYRKKTVWNLPVYLFLAVYSGMIANSFFLDTLHWRYLWFFLGLSVIIINQAAKARLT
jgi:hypothetical protein